MLCTHKTASSASLVLEICHQFTNPFLNQFLSIFGGNCINAAHRWPKAISANLWLQAIKHVVNVRNSLPRPGKTESPLSKFAGTSVQPNLKHFHPFGCPVYVLQAPLQTRSPFPKWGECSRIGIFLCHSPHHVSSIPLVLSTQTRLMSPQFHCVFNDNFDTVKKEQADTSIWKVKALLQEAKE